MNQVAPAEMKCSCGKSFKSKYQFKLHQVTRHSGQQFLAGVSISIVLAIIAFMLSPWSGVITDLVKDFNGEPRLILTEQTPNNFLKFSLKNNRGTDIPDIRIEYVTELEAGSHRVELQNEYLGANETMNFVVKINSDFNCSTNIKFNPTYIGFSEDACYLYHETENYTMCIPVKINFFVTSLKNQIREELPIISHFVKADEISLVPYWLGGDVPVPYSEICNVVNSLEEFPEGARVAKFENTVDNKVASCIFGKRDYSECIKIIQIADSNEAKNEPMGWASSPP